MAKRTWLVIGAVSLLFVIAAGGAFYVLKSGKALLRPAVTFQLQPLKARGELVVEPTTSFRVKSSRAIKADELKTALVVEPAVQMTVQSVDETTFYLKPTEDLQPDTIYTVAIQEPLAQKKQSWAYQVIAPFGVVSTVPGNFVNDVPTETGIELTLNREAEPFQEYFDIQPAVKGKFEQKDYTLVFVPQEPLAYKTIYTVTLKKGLKEKDGADLLSEDTVVTFETQSKEEYVSNAPYLSFEKSFWEFVPSRSPVFSLSAGNIKEARFVMYRFKGYDEFLSEYSRIHNEQQSWSLYHDEIKLRLPKDQKIFDEKLKVEELGYYSSYASLPQKFDKGFYGVEAYIGDELVDTAWVQISNLIGFSAVAGGNSVVWINDGATKQGVAGARIEYRGQMLGTTDTQGLASFPTPKEQVVGTPENIEGDSSKYPFVIVSSGDDTLLLSSFSQNAYQPDEWWEGLTVDKPIYAPTDTVHFWGFLKRRDDTDIKGNQLSVEVRDAYDNGEKDDGNAYTQAVVRLGGQNTYIGKLDYASLTPGYYSVVVRYGDTVVSSQQINVQTYVKPAYTMSVTPDRSVGFVGDKITYTAKAQFFDGTPVSGLKILYTDEASKREDQKSPLMLDANGEGTFTTVIPDTGGAGRGLPSIYTTTIEPEFSEEAQISTSTFVVSLPARSILSVDSTYEGSKANFAISLHSVDISRGLAEEGGTDEELYYGSPIADKAIQVAITRTEYVKELTERKYDPYTKTTYPIYDFRRVETTLPGREIRTDKDGKASFSWDADEKYSYQIRFKTKDEKGVTLVSEHDVYTPYLGSYYSSPLGINLVDKNAQKYYYKIGDEIEVGVERNDGTKMKEGKDSFLYLRVVNGTIFPFVSDAPDYKDTFMEKYIPNIEIAAAWFSGERYYSTGDYWYGSNLNFNFDSDDRRLNVTITKDKERYRPRETARLAIDVKDAKGQPRKTHVLVSAIDAALKTFGETPTLDPQLYKSLYTQLFINSTHETPLSSGAEGGGCFLKGTSILTPEGERSIEELRPGDYVLTRANRSDPTLVPARIWRITSQPSNEYITINGTLSMTSNHKLLVNDRWTSAGAISVGDTLVDSKGEPVSVESVLRKQVVQKVYNIEIENQHTFFADGIYVHNQEKGGGEGAPRTEFKDTVYFQTVETDENGHAQVSFPLPDNLTSWSTKAEAVTPDLYTGYEEISLPVSIPFFVEATVNQTYLEGDDLTVRLRTFGTETADKQITYTVESPTLPFGKIEKQGGNSMEISLGQLPKGLHPLTITARLGTLSDTLVRMVDVRDTYFSKKVSDYQFLKRGKETDFSSLASKVQGYATLTACSCERNNYLSDLYWLQFGGVRLDELAADAVAASLEEKYFVDENTAEQEAPAPRDLTSYQRDTGGFGIVRHGGDELYASALVAQASRYTDLMLYSKQQLVSYLYTSMNDQKTDRTRRLYALWGLAGLGEPILDSLQYYLTDKDLTLEEKVYVASALASLGAREKAKEYYESQIRQQLVDQQPYLFVRGLKDGDVDLRVTAVLGYLLASVQDESALRALAYIREYSPTKTRIDLEHSLILAEVIPQLSDEEAVIEYETPSGVQTVTVSKDKRFYKRIGAQELVATKIRAKKGNVSVSLAYNEGDPSKKNIVDPAIELDRSYHLKGDTRFTELHDGDLVKITLTPKIDKSVQQDSFEITDYLPSGLRAIETSPSYNGEYDYKELPTVIVQDQGYPTRVDGQRVVFDWYKGSRPFYYYARVVSKGSFRAESAQIQSSASQASVNYSSEDAVVIK